MTMVFLKKIADHILKKLSMKILVIGFVVLFGWSALSTYVYVCKIKGLCAEQEAIVTAPVVTADVIKPLAKPVADVKAVIPGNLLIYFGFDKSDFSSDSSAGRYFTESNKYLGQNPQARLSITGHTDAIGSEEYNQALGYRRAQTMQKYFTSRGMPAVKIITESKGEKDPVADNLTADGRAKNRRTVITIKN